MFFFICTFLNKQDDVIKNITVNQMHYCLGIRETRFSYTYENIRVYFRTNNCEKNYFYWTIQPKDIFYRGYRDR